MALGGGTFTSQNKELPGAYINFVSAASASAALSDRGIATMPLELDWGVEGEVFEVTNEDFQKNSLKLFGYAFDSPKMLGLNDLFMGAKTLYAYRLNGGGDKAANTYATAKYCGVRGNDLKIVIQKNADDASKENTKEIADAVKNSAYEIINKKHATYYGIAMSVKRICEVIMRDEKSILPVSHMIHGVYEIDDVVLSMPVIVGADGIESDIPINLSGEEALKLKESADALKNIIETLEL